MAGSTTETEIKIAVASFAPLRRKLAELGFRRAKARVFEANELFDTPAAGLRGQGCILRMRQVGRRSILTFKGPSSVGKHKSREELETTVGDEGRFRAILDRLGYRPTFRYEKYRTEYSDGDGVVTLDETPIGNYVELEGKPAWIDRTARKLGYAEAVYITSSYGRLYVEYCARQGQAPSNMVF